MIRPSSTAGMLAALRSARRVTFAAYVLHPGPVEAALAAAARRGARVSVRLDGYLWGGTPAMARENREAIQTLRRAHADARLVHRRDGDGPGLHVKAAVCDGTAFLDDCNWNLSGDTVVRDDCASHVRAVRAAALGRESAPAGVMRFDKAGALEQLAQVLHRASSGTVCFESEWLHPCAVSGALRELAARSIACRVLVSARAAKSDAKTQREIASLERAGVQVRATASGEKIALAAGRGWVGSADATSAYADGDRIEWSLATSDSRILGTLRAHFNAHWRASTPA